MVAVVRPPFSVSEWHRGVIITNRAGASWLKRTRSFIQNKINLLTNSELMAASRSVPRLWLERASGQEQIKKQHGRLRETKAAAGSRSQWGKNRGNRTGIEYSSVWRPPRRESRVARRLADRWWLMVAICPPSLSVCWSGFYHRVNWPLHKARCMPFVSFCNGLYCLEVCALKK